jgi:hypothetical protein
MPHSARPDARPKRRSRYGSRGGGSIATSARSSTSGSCSADCLTATMTATAADQLRPRLAFDRDPAPARRPIRHRKGLSKPDLEVGDAGLEPATSSLYGRLITFPEVSGCCKMPANAQILRVALFPPFQKMHLGCCTVAAQGHSRNDDTHESNAPSMARARTCLVNCSSLAKYRGRVAFSPLEKYERKSRQLVKWSVERPIIEHILFQCFHNSRQGSRSP